MTTPTQELPPPEEPRSPRGQARSREDSTELREPVRAQAAGRGLLVAASAVVVLAGLKAATTIIVPFLLAFFLACVTLPLLNFLKNLRSPYHMALSLPIKD